MPVPAHNPPIGKAVVLARGLGTRMRQRDDTAALAGGQARFADIGLKAMIPVGQPFLDYVLSGLADAGYREVCLVIGPEHDAVREHYCRMAPPRRIRIACAIQPEPRGTAAAALAAEDFAAGEDFLVINSDNLYPAAALQQLRVLGEPGTALFEQDALISAGNIPPGRVREFAFGVVDESGYLSDIVEKPGDAMLQAFGPHALVSMNCWRFSPAIFPACRDVPLSPRDELELPWAVRAGIRTGGLRLKVIRFRGGVLDLSRRADIATVAERLRGVEANP